MRACDSYAETGESFLHRKRAPAVMAKMPVIIGMYVRAYLERHLRTRVPARLRHSLTAPAGECEDSRMLARALKRIAVLGLVGTGLSLSSCASNGFAGDIYMSPDDDGKRTQTNFFSDYVESPAIYVIIPIVSGRKDYTLTATVKVRSIGKDPVDFPPILVYQDDPGLAQTKTEVSVQFPDPPAVEVANPADPLTPLKIKPPRAIGRFQFIATMGGDTETVNFAILPPTIKALPDPNDGTPNAKPPDGSCSDQGDPTTPASITRCPQPTQLHSVVCCTSAGNCGTGVEGTGLCY